MADYLYPLPFWGIPLPSTPLFWFVGCSSLDNFSVNPYSDGLSMVTNSFPLNVGYLSNESLLFYHSGNFLFPTSIFAPSFLFNHISLVDNLSGSIARFFCHRSPFDNHRDICCLIIHPLHHLSLILSQRQ